MALGEGWNRNPRRLHTRTINLRHQDVLFHTCLRQHQSHGIDDQAVADETVTRLAGSHHITGVLNRPRHYQGPPLLLLQSTLYPGAGHEQDLCSIENQSARDLREPQLVADEHSRPPQWRRYGLEEPVAGR